jgi:hypothetical protein
LDELVDKLTRKIMNKKKGASVLRVKWRPGLPGVAV